MAVLRIEDLDDDRLAQWPFHEMPELEIDGTGSFREMVTIYDHSFSVNVTSSSGYEDIVDDGDGILIFSGPLEFERDPIAICAGQFFGTNESQTDSPGVKMKTLWSVTVWSVEDQKILCFQNAYVGSKENVRAVFAMRFDIDPEEIEKYDFLISERGRVRGPEEL